MVRAAPISALRICGRRYNSRHLLVAGAESTRRRDINERLPVSVIAGVREVWVVDLDAAIVAIYSGEPAAPATVFVAGDTLTSDMMPRVGVELGPIFARVVNA